MSTAVHSNVVPLLQMTTLSSGTKYADPAEVEKKAQSWTDEILNCRLYSHNWRPSRAKWEENGTVLHTVRVCSSCDSEKHYEMTRSGNVFSTWYVYSEGYLSVGLGRIVGEGRDVLRVASISREYPDLMSPPKRSKAKTG
jgi:hypothetical protein